MIQKKVEKMKILFSDKQGQGVNDGHDEKSWPTKDMDIAIECSIFCEEITAGSEQERVSHKKTNIITNVTAECRAMLLYTLEVSNLDLYPENSYSNRNTRSFCLVHEGAFWLRNLKLAPTNSLYTAKALPSSCHLMSCSLLSPFLRFAQECVQSRGNL